MSRKIPKPPEGAARNDTQLKAQALACMRANQPGRARALFAEVCRANPGDPEAWYLLGAMNGQLGRFEEAIQCGRKAIHLAPNHVDAHFNLALAYQFKGDVQNAIAEFKKVLNLQRDHIGALMNLAILLSQAGVLDEALSYSQDVLKAMPDNVDALFAKGGILSAQGRLDEASKCYQRIIAMRPDHAESYNNLGNIQQAQGRLEDAAGNYQTALRLKPDFAQAHNNLGIVYGAQGKLDEAVSCCREALRLNPTYDKACNNLGNALLAQGRLGEAAENFKAALRINPQYAEAHNNLGNVFCAQGRPQEAISKYQDALRCQPDYAAAHSNLLFCLNYADMDPAFVFDAHKKWSQAHEQALSHETTFENQPDPTRKIRIGYVSADLRAHSISYFLEPLLENHDAGAFEIYCYSDVKHPDATTQRLRSLSHQWRNICGMSDAQVCEQIRADAIDILVDLAGHTGKNRLLVFARKPAPLQVTWLGYPNTTGLSSMDYRITDSWADPVGDADRRHTESLIRLEDGFLCYKPPLAAPPVSPPPSIQTGVITFGSFNALAKITPLTIKLWSNILNDLPASRLLLKNNSLHDEATRIYLSDCFSEHGVDSERIQLYGWHSDVRDHLLIYNQIDIALDTFPYNGTTTTCEALWMGVPVITLMGATHAGRVGTSLLSRLGLSEWIAKTNDEYHAIAVRAAVNAERLSALRDNLRAIMSRSTLCDGHLFAKHMESAYRIMWRTYCDRIRND